MNENAQLTPPRIGQPWPGQGGTFIGTLRGELGGPDWHIIKADVEGTELAFGQYGKTVEGAESDRDGVANTAALLAAGNCPAAEFASKHSAEGHTDFYLPSRHELQLMYLNAPEGLDVAGWYWSSTQYSAGLAWVQDFSYGYQYCDDKGGQRRVRPVRRIQAQ